MSAPDAPVRSAVRDLDAEQRAAEALLVRCPALARAPREGGDHRMSNPEHQQRLIEACVAWYRQRLAL